MTGIRVTIVDDDGKIESALAAIQTNSGTPYLLEKCTGVYNALLAVINTNPDLCIVADYDSSGSARPVLEKIREAGLHTLILVLTGTDDHLLEQELTNLGAVGVIPSSTSLEPGLRFAIRLAHAFKLSESRLRENQNELIAHIYEIRDARERAEEQNEQIVTLAEELALANKELEKLNREKTRFFSIIAHDLRSPFNSILGYTELLAYSGDSLPEKKVREFASNINDAATKVYDLLESLLDWARVQMEYSEPDRQPTALTHIVDRVFSAVETAAADKGIGLEMTLGDEIAHVDPNMIETVVRNLVTNGIKFTHAGGRIKVSAKETVSGGDKYFEVSVADNGIGMNESRVATIFSPGEGVPTAGTNGEQGSGLGLLLCKELVERNKGEIHVLSSPGKGATFTFTVPVNQ